MEDCGIIVCLCLISVGHKSLQIHEHMTDEELQSVFHTDRNSVPEYEVVPVRHSQYNGKKNLQVYFEAFGDDVSLQLSPADDVLFSKNTPVYAASSNPSYPNGLKYKLIYGTTASKKRVKIYEDLKKMASLALYDRSHGKIHFNGLYGSRFIMRSLPNRVLRIMNRNKTHRDSKFLSQFSSQSDYMKITNHHVVLKFPKDVSSAHKDNYGSRESPEISKPRTRNKESVENDMNAILPEIIYPEILLIIDYDSYRSHGKNLWESIVYYAAFFNAVDLRYRILKEPKVRLSIAAIIIAVDKGATPYLTRNRIKENLLGTGALDELSLYLYRETRFPRDSYDAVIAITRSKLCQFSKNSTDPSYCHAVRGISKYGTACNWDDSTKRVESVALIHDSGFSGIPTAAHELAHVFGVPHDGSPSLAYVGGPGAEKCKWADGYLMSSFRHDKHALKWSICSQRCFTYFAKKRQARCMYNVPTRPGGLPRILPGKLLSVDEQCYRAIGGGTCSHNANVCTLLWCRVPNTISDCVASTPAAEGSKCGTDMICVQGRCIEESQIRREFNEELYSRWTGKGSP